MNQTHHRAESIGLATEYGEYFDANFPSWISVILLIVGILGISIIICSIIVCV